MGQAEGRPYEMAISRPFQGPFYMAGPQLAPFYLQRCPLHSCQVDRIEKCPSTKSAVCGLRNPYPLSVWRNSVTPCTYVSVYLYIYIYFSIYIYIDISMSIHVK